MAANAASQLGISVVAAAGNAGDLYDAEGSPGNATRVISVANSVDAYSQIDTLHATVQRGSLRATARERSVDYAWASKPDLSGSVVKLTSDVQPRRLRPDHPEPRRQGRVPRVDGRQRHPPLRLGGPFRRTPRMPARSA